MILPEDSIAGCSYKSGSLAAAMQMGKTIITAKGYMTSPELVDGLNILFTDFNDIISIKKKILSVMESVELRRQIGYKAQICAKNKTWSSTYEKYFEIIDQLK